MAFCVLLPACDRRQEDREKSNVSTVPGDTDSAAVSVTLVTASAEEAALPGQPAPQATREPGSWPPQVQIEEYHAQRPKTVVELQPFRETTSMAIENNAGQRGTATLINLNPRINVWFLLTLEWADGRGGGTYHLENPEPASQKILLDPQYPQGIVIVGGKKSHPCDLWSGSSTSGLAEARASRRVYAPLCEGRLYLRNKTEGHKTTMEWATDFLRTYVPGGERITTFVRETFYQDTFLDTSEVIAAETPGVHAVRPRPSGAPAPPLVNPLYSDYYLAPAELGIALYNQMDSKVLVGRWYRARDLPGIFVSTIQPKLVAEEVIRSQQGRVNPLDEIESSALVYLVAFDLNWYEVGFAMGTEHPRVDWSPRVRQDVRDPALPGPDGIGTVAPLINTGMVNPDAASQIAATFVGGFKRYHSAFRWGDLALKHHGSHYGVIENGVIMSKLQPGLATALVFADGAIDLKTWTEQDNAGLERVRHARQNGVPLIEYDAVTGTSKPGALVSSWGLGNWSASHDKRYRTLRSGLALQEHEGNRFLIYGYFSTATPSAMARVFQAYRCTYAMLLDMNALEHTYLAIYRVQDSQFLVQHLIKGMNVLDKSAAGQVVPRFVGYADNRDFFYLLKRIKR